MAAVERKDSGDSPSPIINLWSSWMSDRHKCFVIIPIKHHVRELFIIVSFRFTALFIPVECNRARSWTCPAHQCSIYHVSISQRSNSHYSNYYGSTYRWYILSLIIHTLPFHIVQSGSHCSICHCSTPQCSLSHSSIFVTLTFPTLRFDISLSHTLQCLVRLYLALKLPTLQFVTRQLIALLNVTGFICIKLMFITNRHITL